MIFKIIFIIYNRGNRLLSNFSKTPKQFEKGKKIFPPANTDQIDEREASYYSPIKIFHNFSANEPCDSGKRMNLTTKRPST
jgi:hypothetical protein